MNPLIYREGGNQPEHFIIGGTRPDIFFLGVIVFVNLDACSVRNLLKLQCLATTGVRKPIKYKISGLMLPINSTRFVGAGTQAVL